jgi:hypothetical protein
MTRRILTFALFESQSILSEEQVKFLNSYTEGKWLLNPSNGLVDVDGDVYCENQKLENMKGVSFGRVRGNFSCSYNEITSLGGAPQEVGGSFSCLANNLTSLEGAPQVVGVNFNCSGNKLTSLEGAPQEVGGNFNCSYNKLTSLEGAPQVVGVSFTCSGNKLTSLKGAPQEVGSNFYCSDNNLTSLEGAPQVVGGYFNCSDNELTSLEGAPQEVGWGFRFNDMDIPGDEWELDKLFLSRWMKNDLIADLFDPELLNQQIAKDPAGMILKLKSIWNKEYFAEIRSNLVWPAGYEEQMGLSGDLGDVGF